ncbi:hypothetical protein MMC29_002594 [Sticta canariensis]|nr:hypothetical protein [Sticta canariensis]
MVQSTLTLHSGSTLTVNGSQVRLSNSSDGESLPHRTDGADGPRKDSSPFHSLAREILFVGVVCVAPLSTQVSPGQTPNLVHVIGGNFNTKNPGTLSWFVPGYSLTVGSFILLFGRFGDYFGYKRFFITGLRWFSLWSMVAGLSNYSNHIFFIFARVFQGKLSTSFDCFSLSRLDTRHWSSHMSSQCCCSSMRHLSSRAAKEPGLRKNIVSAVFGAVAPGGAIIGAIIGGVFQDDWPWAFYSLALVLATAAIVSYFVILDRLSKTVERSRLRNLFPRPPTGFLFGLLSTIQSPENFPRPGQPAVADPRRPFNGSAEQINGTSPTWRKWFLIGGDTNEKGAGSLIRG